ncbi:glycoside hydrolase family 16 protein [Rhizobium rhizogenes]|nr:glycoside hydrolase family 16 protein [Rhizobium rhizogenes]
MNSKSVMKKRGLSGKTDAFCNQTVRRFWLGLVSFIIAIKMCLFDESPTPHLTRRCQFRLIGIQLQDVFVGGAVRGSILTWLLAMILYAAGSPAHAVSVDCGENQSFSAGLGGWGPWWSGSTPVVDTSVGHTDSQSLRLQGGPGTASRYILPTECPLGIAYVNYWVRTQTGSARIYTKLVDQMTDAVLYDSVNAGPTVVGTTWTRISIPVMITNETLIGITAEPVSPATNTTVYIDDVVVANDACANQSFTQDTGGFVVWWSGNAVAITSPGRTDDWSLKLSGSPYGTAKRDISPGECPQPLTRVAYYVRAETGSALVHTKLVDQVTDETLWDTNTGPIAVSSTAWTRVVIDVPMPNTTLIGITAERQDGGAVSVLVDDVMLNPGIAASLPTQPDNVPVPVRDGWALTFSDEFSNGTLDPAKWVAITTGPTYGSSTEGFGETWGTECYDASQVAIKNGSLQLTAKQQSVSCLGITKSWLSGLVISKDRFSQAFGRLEARIRMPVARGAWPAFWMMPQLQKNWGTCGMYWPCGGEIDILEYVGQLNSTTNATEDKTVHSTLHWGTSTGGHTQDSGSANVIPSVDRWTVYAAQWDTTGISFFIDDNFVKKTTFPLPKSSGLYARAEPFDVPFYFILNQSVGGVWPGTPDPADYPNTVKTDYVAAYKRL